MQIHTLDKAGIINELKFGSGISHAVEQGRRADFALLLSMFSNDVRDCTPIDAIDEIDTSEQQLRKQFGVSEPQPLRSDQSSYDISAKQSEQFHQASLVSAKLSHYLKPEPLAYMPEDTFDLPEDVYQNLSGHDRRKLANAQATELPQATLYNELSTASRLHQIQVQA
ncbi:VC2046/SO_2500 family protein [Vibrio profundi]|uniref:VC2046/SO_2500 family protein n=1 Tax=Vibrio profundi TaxID=1774960 RepID=UPI0037361146